MVSIPVVAFKILPFALLSLMALADHYGTVSVLAHSHRLFTDYMANVFEGEHWQRYIDNQQTNRNFDKLEINDVSTADLLDAIEWKTGMETGRTNISVLEKEVSSYVRHAHQATQIFVDILATTLAGVAVISVGLLQIPSTKTIASMSAYEVIGVSGLVYFAVGILVAWRGKKCFLSSNPMSSDEPDAIGCQYVIEYAAWLYVLFNAVTIVIVVSIETMLA